MLDSKIPALSIREPYATLILEGKKDIELRNWKPLESAVCREKGSGDRITVQTLV